MNKTEMSRRRFLANSSAFFAALAASAKVAGALPIGFPEEPQPAAPMAWRLSFKYDKGEFSDWTWLAS